MEKAERNFVKKKFRDSLYNIILGTSIALGIWFGAIRMVLVPLFNCLYASRIGVLTMAFAVQCILTSCAGILLTAVSGLVGLGLAVLFCHQHNKNKKHSIRTAAV